MILNLFERDVSRRYLSALEVKSAFYSVAERLRKKLITLSALDSFIELMMHNLKKNHFPHKKVSFKKSYLNKLTQKRGISLKSVLENLKKHEVHFLEKEDSFIFMHRSKDYSGGLESVGKSALRQVVSRGKIKQGLTLELERQTNKSKRKHQFQIKLKRKHQSQIKLLMLITKFSIIDIITIIISLIIIMLLR